MPGTTKPSGIPNAPPGKHTPWEALSVFMKLSQQKTNSPPNPVGNRVPRAGEIDDAVDEQRTISQHCVQQLEEAAQIIETEAKHVIGTYEYGWPQLDLATQQARERKGFDPNDPLLMTGELKDSIQHYVDPNRLTAEVGSNNPKALWQELGTSRGIPPRSFLLGAAMRKEREIVQRTGVNIHGLITRQLGMR